MGIFSFLSNSNQSAPEGELDHNASRSQNESTLIPEETFIEKGRPNSNFQSTQIPTEVTTTTNLDYLFKALDQNLEFKGYDDALINPDSYHLDQNVDALRKDLIRTINKVKTFYEDFIREIEFHIESRSRSGMIDTVEELKMKKETAESHIEKVLIIESDAINKTGDSEGIIVSYTRGFRNGLAAISHHTIISRKF
jgi:HD-GYP domain-containing protein (c-di-GMP phosphodiesterase class II)